MTRMRSFKTFVKANDYVGLDTCPHKAAKKKELKESLSLLEVSHHERVKNHPAVESVDDGGRGEYFVNLKKDHHWSGQGSFGADSASHALRMLKDVKQGHRESVELTEGLHSDLARGHTRYSTSSGGHYHHPEAGQKHHDRFANILQKHGFKRANATGTYRMTSKEDNVDYSEKSQWHHPDGRKAVIVSGWDHEGTKLKIHRPIRNESTELTEKVHGATPKTFVSGTARNNNVQNDLHDRLTKHYNFDDTDQKHIATFNQYHTDMNKALKEKNKPKEETSKEVKKDPASEASKKEFDTGMQQHTKEIDAAFGQHKSPTADFHAYIPIKGHPAEVHSQSTGVKHDGKSEMRFQMHHFAHGSITPSVAAKHALNSAGFGKDKSAHVLKVKIPGQSKHGVYTGGDNKEFLFRPGRKVHVHSDSEEHSHEKGKIHIWHGEMQG